MATGQEGRLGGKGSRGWWLAACMPVLLIVAIVGFVSLGSDDPDGTEQPVSEAAGEGGTDPASEIELLSDLAASGIEPADAPDTDDMLEADRLLQQQLDSGWIAYSNASAFDEAVYKGFVAVGAPRLPAEAGQPTRMPVYDEPNGAIIGYSYEVIGFVQRNVADSPTFDPAALVLAEFGCDPFVAGITPSEKGECTSSIMQQVGVQRNS